MLHHKISGFKAIHQAFFIGSSDPASDPANDVQEYANWIDTTTGTSLADGWIHKQRNAGNTAWVTVLDLKTALDGKQGLDAELTAIAALGSAANKLIRFTGSGSADLLDFSTDGTFASNSDTKIPSEKAIKTYADAAVAAGGIAASLIDALGDLIYGSADNTAARLAGNTSATKKFLTQTGNGTISAAPAWGTIGTTDLPAHSVVGTESYGDSSTKAASTAFVQAALGTRADDGNTGTAKTVDWSTANFRREALTGNCTFTFTAPSNSPAVLVMELVQGSGPYTATWPSTVHWAGGTAPTLSTTSGKVDLITFYWNGTTYFGVVSGQNFTA